MVHNDVLRHTVTYLNLSAKHAASKSWAPRGVKVCFGCCVPHPTDPTVLLRVHEYLDIICTRLGRSQGLIFEDYVPAADPKGQWTPAAGTVVNYGESLDWHMCWCCGTADYGSTYASSNGSNAAAGGRQHLALL
jgi:hypothetical protein